MQNRVYAAEIASSVNRANRPGIITRAAQLGIKVIFVSYWHLFDAFLRVYMHEYIMHIRVFMHTT
jgi:hypothetical protein